MNNYTYLSDIIENNGVIEPRQTLEYKYVKTYPSVNSTNNGQINSETNIRWLTKQLTKKPFIFPRDGSPEEDMFKTHGYGSLYAIRVDGGMVNVDGYVMSIANDVNDVDFDSTADTGFGSNNTGYIYNQIMQKTLIQMSQGIVSSNIRDFIGEVIDALGGNPSESQIANYIETNIRPSVLATKENYKIGEVTITYKSTDVINIVEYIDNMNTDIKETFTKQIDGSSYYYKHDYDVYYGYINNSTLKTEDINKLFLFFTDAFGFTYIFTNSNDSSHTADISTHPYPSTFDNRINMCASAIGDGSQTPPDVIYNMFAQTNNDIYDVTSLYVDTVEINNKNFAIRNDATTISTETLTDVLSIYDNITSAQMITNYANYKSIPVTSITELPTKYGSDAIADNTYCIPNTTSDTKFNAVMQHLERAFSFNSNSYIPVAILNSAGRLCPFNIEFAEVISGQRRAYTLAEGYVTFLRRVASLLINTSNYNQDYINNPNGDDYPEYGGPTLDDGDAFRHTWTNVFKDIENNGIQATSTVQQILDNVFGSSITDMCNFFGIYGGTYALSNIKFHHIYNTLIVPYINNYMQIAWTALYANAVNFNDSTSTDSKFTVDSALTSYRNAGITIKDDEYWRGYVETEHQYQVGTNAINQTFDYLVEDGTYTDYNRLYTFLCYLEKTSLDNNGFDYRVKVPMGSSGITKISLCEDYINYIKRSCSNTADDNTDTDNKHNRLIIPYRITKLNGDTITTPSNAYIDDDRVYCKSGDYPSSSADIGSADKQSLEVGFIQNATIDLTTMLPVNGMDDSFWYETAADTYNRHESNQYDLKLKTSITRIRVNSRSEGSFAGLDGLQFSGCSQGFTTNVPTVLRLYKDSQNYLNGKTPGASTHNGVAVDYRFPIDLKSTDFWIFNTWISTIRTISDYNIEDNSSYPPYNTDAGDYYLTARNHTILGTDKIYGIDHTTKDYISFDDTVKNITTDVINDFISDVFSTETRSVGAGIIKITPMVNNFFDIRADNQLDVWVDTSKIATAVKTQGLVRKIVIRCALNTLDNSQYTIRFLVFDFKDGVQDTWTTTLDTSYNSSASGTNITLSTESTTPVEALVELTFTPNGNICTAQIISPITT